MSDKEKLYISAFRQLFIMKTNDDASRVEQQAR